MNGILNNVCETISVNGKTILNQFVRGDCNCAGEIAYYTLPSADSPAFSQLLFNKR